MRTMKVKVSSFALAFCLVLVFALCGAVARADEDYTFKLTVKGTGSTEAAVLADIANADVVVDVYKIADATKDDAYDTYNYSKWATGFEEVKTEFEAIQAATAVPVDQRPVTDWAALYAKAAKVVADGGTSLTPVTKPLGEIQLSGRGLYLVIAHGTGQGMDAKNGYSGVAYGDHMKFYFPPTMISAPTKLDANGTTVGPIYTDYSYGKWLDAATIVLKSSFEPLFGRLQINKTVNEYKGEETTFSFHIYSVDPTTHQPVYGADGELQYEEYAAITFPGQSSTTVTRIPAGMTVAVDEEFSGSRYKRVSDNGQIAVIVSNYAADKSDSDSVVPASVSFVNEPNGNNPDGGHGIENNFKTTDAANPYGEWTMTPSKPIPSGNEG